MTTPTVTPLYRVAEGIFEMHNVRVFNVLSDSTNRIHVVLVSHGHAHCDGPHCKRSCKHVRKVMASIEATT